MAGQDPLAALGGVPATPAAQPTSSAPTPTQDPLAALGGIPATAASAQQPESALGKVGDFVKGVGEGATQSMGETIQGLPWVGKKILSPEDMQAEREYFKPGSAAEKYGQTTGDIAEPVLEFVLGDEALKGVAISDKIGLASKIADISKNYPYIGKILQHGVNAARMGTVGAADALAKGATPSAAIKTGVESGIGGEAISTAIDAAPAATRKISSLRVNPFRRAVNAFTGSDIQPTLKSGIQDVWNKVADEAGVPHPTASSVRDMGDEVGDSILARSKQTYAKIDAATDNRWSGTEEKLRNVRQALRSVTNDNEEAPLLVDKTRYEMQLSQMLDDAAKQPDGFTRSDVEAAKSDFKQAQAVYDTNQHIRMTTTGVRAGAPGAEATPETVNAKGLVNRLEKQYEPKGGGRIQQALGEDNSRDLIGHASTAEKAGRTTARNAKAGKYVAGTAGVGGVAELYHTLAK